MERESGAVASPLERLPPELIRAILSELDSLDTLHCAVLSCRVLWYCFSGNSSGISTRIVFNHLDPCDVRPEALAALQASSLPGPTISLVREFCALHLSNRHVDSGISVTIAEAAAIAKLQSTVSRLADEFVKTNIRKLPTPTHGEQTSLSLEPSKSEKRRIMRALYAIEIFYNLFRKTTMSDEGVGQCMNEFLLNFAPWEIEQIACVHEFLFLHISPAFDDIAAHDVLWGEFEVEPAQWFGSPDLQTVLFQGLVTLESIAKANTYTQRYDLLHQGRIPPTRDRTLYRALKDINYEGIDDRDASVSGYGNSQDYAFRVKSAFFEDPDNGPFTIWKWAHESQSLRQSVYQREKAPLRKWGYVMWDRDRLDACGILQDRWQPPVTGRSLPDDPPREMDDERWISSWRERSRIHMEGGSGWWDFGDESKIVWARRKAGGVAKAPDTPKSLDEAKRAILALQRH
ncbi:uncharacterized protein F4807DRAFT_312305 [Annulohypoxylon truncatum]|uniref:uncharacterized protein n=1 Tax=Annulohypoxylon truncatum TaxID=327061 RepID=UPI002008A780|nr:uncharacterized protein F4807DRAFT_312305 [Annulohypoxylon truncatum]KAI1213130.1 hypothetical protein F4807DRAFT_312305 [Annulohypoxylon truncatum]